MDENDAKVLGFDHWYNGKNDKLSYHEKFKPQPPLVIIPTRKRKKMKQSQSPPPKKLKQTSTQINKAVASETSLSKVVKMLAYHLQRK